MSSCVVAIAKDEDAYIAEWANWHHNIGFDEVVVYANDWKMKWDAPSWVRVIQWPGSIQQLAAYNHFISNLSKSYDWAAFIDVDEFIYPGKFGDVKTMLDAYQQWHAVALNWKLFGSSGIKSRDVTQPVVTTFTHSQARLNQHVKTIVNLKLCRRMMILEDVRFVNPHYVGIASRAYFTIRADSLTYVHGPFAEFDEYAAIGGLPYIAHYLTKSHDECIARRSRPRADTGSPREDPEEFFKQHDNNEVENHDIVSLQERMS